MPTPIRCGARLALLAALVVVAAASCSSDPQFGSPSLSSSPSSARSASPDPNPLLTVETRGGNCPNGPCGSVITIGRDGAVHEVRPSVEDLGTIPKAELDTLAAEIDRANFPLIGSRPFTGECPTAFDGQETIYTFHLPTGDEEIATCRVAINPRHPVFLAVGAAMRTLTSEGP
jgi:hypothetical protein